MLQLRDYQRDCLDAIWNSMCEKNRASLVVMSTGAGKTVVFQALLEKSIQAKPTLKAVVLFHKVTLLDQQTKRMEGVMKNVGQYCASLGRKDNTQILMASIQSIVKSDITFDLIIVDETHRVNDEEGDYFEFFNKNPNAKIVGFTATPYRSTGYIYGKNKLYKEITYQKDLSFFINNNYLVPPICKHPDHVFETKNLKIVAGDFSQKQIDELTDDVFLIKEQVIDALNRLGSRKKIVWAGSNIKHCEEIKKVLCSFGESTVTVHSQQDDYSSLDSFMTDESIRHLTFVTVIAEGMDFPAIDAVVLMRPTASPMLMVQIVGRGLRLFEGKKDCLVLDYARVFETCGTLNNPIIKEKGKSKLEEKPTKICKNCAGINHISAKVCEQCNTEFEGRKLNFDKMTLLPSDADPLKSDEIVMPVVSVDISKILSKAGNECYVIEYRDSQFAFSSSPIREYFVIGNNYAEKRWALRSSQLKITKETLQVHQKPDFIKYKMEGKYPRVLDLIKADDFDFTLPDQEIPF